MDGPRKYCVKLNVRESQIPYNFTYMWNLNKKIKQINKTKQKQIHRYRKQADGC